MSVSNEAIRLLGTAQLGGGKTEDPDCRIGERIALGRSTADGIILGQNDPVVLSASRSQTSSARC